LTWIFNNDTAMTVKSRSEGRAKDDQDFTVRAPNAMLIAMEARAPWEWGSAMAAWPMLRMLNIWPKPEAGDEHHVIVYPGLAATDLSTQPLRAFLRDMGYTVHGWYQGRNRGPGRGVLERLEEQLVAVHSDARSKLSLIGWSLGGIYARELAKMHPARVRQVITLGTPFAHGPKATNAWRVYEMLAGETVPDEVRIRELATAPSVPTTSIYSKTDGVVAWQASIQSPSAKNKKIENIEVFASHLGIGANPAAWYTIADRLARATNGATRDAWKPFTVPANARFLFGE
jgi:pimeloyl-ACP methyl ester carboxylesterase